MGERKAGSLVAETPVLNGSMAGSAFVDKTLTKSGAAADAKVVGERLAAVDSSIASAVDRAVTKAQQTGLFDGEDGTDATHEWVGTVLRITTASGTSEADLKGERGDKGEKGDTGERGAQGIPGDRGLQGEQGIQGERGEKGEKGDTGESGIVAPVGGFFSLAVDADGNLWAYSVDGNAPTFEYDEESGNLYVIQEVD